MSTGFHFDPTAAGATLSLCEAAVAASLPDVPEITADALAARLAARLANQPPVWLLDVRPAAEHAVGRIPGARPAPPGTPPGAALAGAPPDATVVLACSVGLRSGRMARAMLDAGLPPGRVLNLRGGIFRWARLGLPMIDDQGATLAVHPFDARWGLLLDR